MPFVLGHARSRTAIHGGNATHETIDAQQIAVWRRGGMLPPADVYPADMRATRDLLRRRMPLMHKRAERLAHMHQTNSQSTLPAIGTTLADQAHRQGVAARCPEPAVQKRRDVELALMDHDDSLRRDVELCLRNTAPQHDSHTLALRRTLPGIGAILSLGRRDDIHDLQRVPRVHAFVSYGRLGTWARASAGKRSGTAGTQIGHAALTWAFAAAAGLLWRANPAGQQSLARVEKNHGPGQAFTSLAHP